MKLPILLLSLLVILTVNSSHAQRKLVESYSLTKENLIKDIDEYANGIEKYHVDPFSKINHKDFLNEISRIKDSAVYYDIDELLVKLFQVNALIGDEHTDIGYHFRDLFPFTFYWFQEGIYSMETLPKYDSLQLLKLIAIDNVPVDTAIKKISTIIANKNTASIRKIAPQYLTDPHILHGLKIIGSTSSIEYTFVKQDGDTLRFRAIAENALKIKLDCPMVVYKFYKYSVPKRYWYNYNSEKKSLYFNYSTCVDNKMYPFENVRNQLISIINDSLPQKLIIDLRENGGGNSTLLEPLIDKIRKSDINTFGEIFVIIGRHTFSSAIHNTMYIKNHTHAIIIGEETSGSINHYGDIRTFKLSNTGMSVYYSTKHFVLDKHNDGAIQPDIKIPETAADFIKGKDAALDYAFTH
ncbi:MAG: hypothetical protein WCG87_00470 [Bacteroidota bacterium]